MAVERTRWLVLAVMFGVGLMQGLGWMTFSGNPSVVSEYYGLANPMGTIDLLLNWGPIGYLPVAPLVAWFTSRRGESVWTVVLCGAVLTMLGLLIRLAPSLLPGLHPQSWGAMCCLHVGQALNGFAGPMNAVTPSIIAATWFPPHERTLATSIVFGIQTAAPAVGFLLALLVKDSTGLVVLMVAEAAAAVLIAIVWSLLPRKPRSPPSASQQLRDDSLGGRPSLPCRRWVSAWVLFIASGLCVGCFQSFASSLPTNLAGVLSEDLLQWFSVITNGASFFSNFAAGPMIERLGLQKRLGRIMVVALSIQFLGFLAFVVLLPDTPLPFGGGGSAPVSVLLLVLTSIAEGILGPVIYELGAELTYPYSESFSGAVFSWILNAFGVTQLLFWPLVPKSFSSCTMAGTSLLALLCMRFVREEYPRRNVDEQTLIADKDREPPLG